MAEGLAIPATSLRRAGSSTAVAMASLLVKLGNQLRVGRGQGGDTLLFPIPVLDESLFVHLDEANWGVKWVPENGKKGNVNGASSNEQ